MQGTLSHFFLGLFQLYLEQSQLRALDVVVPSFCGLKPVFDFSARFWENPLRLRALVEFCSAAAAPWRSCYRCFLSLVPAFAVLVGLQFWAVSAIVRQWSARGQCRAESAGKSDAQCVTTGASFSF